MCAQVGYKSYLSWVLILCMITTHFCNIVAVKCGRSGGGGLFIVTMSSAMLFNMRVKRWGTCATGVQVKISKDLIGQVVGKARCLASGQHM